MKRDMAREAFAGIAAAGGADFGSDFGGVSFGTDLSAYFGANAHAELTGKTSAIATPTGKSTTTTTTSKVSAPTAPKATTTTTVTKTTVVAPKAPILPSVSKLTPVHPALQPPTSLKTPFAMAVPSAIKPKSISAPSGSILGRITGSAQSSSSSPSLLSGFVPSAAIKRTAPPPLAAPRTGVSAFAPPAPFVPSAPTGRYAPPAPSPFITPPTGRYNQGDSYRALQRTAERRALVNSLTPEQSYYRPAPSIWNRLNPFNWFRHEEGLRHRASAYGQRGYRDQCDSYRAMQRAAEARALADSLTPEQSYYPERRYYAEPTITIEDVGDQDDVSDVSTNGSFDDDANPDLQSPQDSVAGDSDVSFAQSYGSGRRHHRHHHRYDQQPVQSSYQTGYMPQYPSGYSQGSQSAFAPPEPPAAPQWSASNPPPPPTGYNNGY